MLKGRVVVRRLKHVVEKVEIVVEAEKRRE
jgi:hypothetical protein